MINKIDLAPYVGASLEVMERDAQRMRGAGPFIFTNLKDGTGLDAVLSWLEQHLKIPPGQRRAILDAQAPYVGQVHSHHYEHA